MTRWDLQKLAEERMLDAEVLLAAGRWSVPYYLAGYAVECAIKACIAKQFQEFEFPDKANVLDSYSHDYMKLFRVAGLDVLEETRRREAFERHWGVVKDWSEAARYRFVDEPRTGQILHAVGRSSGWSFGMVGTALVEEYKNAGRDFLARLDEAGVDVRAALWLYVERSEDWRLVLAIPEVDKAGTAPVYARILPVLTNTGN